MRPIPPRLAAALAYAAHLRSQRAFVELVSDLFLKGKPMDSTLFEKLDTGDLVRNTGSGNSYIVQRLGKRLVGIRVIPLDHPPDWELPEIRRPGKESP